MLCHGCTCLAVAPSDPPTAPFQLLRVPLVRLTARCIELHASADLHSMIHLLCATDYSKRSCRVVTAFAFPCSVHKIWFGHPCRATMSANAMGGICALSTCFRGCTSTAQARALFNQCSQCPRTFLTRFAEPWKA